VLALNGAGVAELRRASALARRLAERTLLVAVDGGLAACRAARRRVDLFVGDADSIAGAPPDCERVLYERDKSFSDLAGALAEARRRDADVLLVAGLLGGRVDHEWCNLLELAAHAAGFAAILAPTGRGLVLLTARGCTLDTTPNRLVTLLAPSGPAVLTLRGTRWTLRRATLSPGSRGLSNRCGERLELRVHRGCVAVVFPARGRG